MPEWSGEISQRYVTLAVEPPSGFIQDMGDGQCAYVPSISTAETKCDSETLPWIPTTDPDTIIDVL